MRKGKNKLFNKIAIVGVGLIGGSIGLELKRKGLVKEVRGFFRKREKLKKAHQLGIVDKGFFDLKQCLKDVDLVILATPVNTIIEIVTRIIKFLKKGCVLIDVGSTKSKVVRSIEKILPKDIYFVGCHPLAGSEKKGVEFATLDLFKDSLCLITNTERTDPVSLGKIKDLWSNLGSKVEVISPTKHDKMVAKISHLPHAVAMSLVDSVRPLELRYAARGFKDMTRIASSDPFIWRDIFLTNAKNIIAEIDKFNKSLNRLRDCIRAKKDKQLLMRLKAIKAKREGIE